MRNSTEQNNRADALSLVTAIVSAYLRHNQVRSEDVAALIHTVHSSLGSLMPRTATAKPAVTVEDSVTDSYIVCLEDGKQLKMLKRYLRSRYNMTPEQYRQKWRLPPDYPMVAPNYSEKRSGLAKKIGLGKNGRGGKPVRRRRAAN